MLVDKNLRFKMREKTAVGDGQVLVLSGSQEITLEAT